ncbi:MAG TPA: FAD:protein FMN transferase, partial [Terriglobales bacterium]
FRCAIAFAAAWIALSMPCTAAAAELFVQTRPAMGTNFTIYLYARNAQHASATFEAAFEEIERLEEALSNYRPSSELSRINRVAAQEEVTTDPEVFGLLQTSLDYSRRTNGAFDITVGPLMRAWGFFRGQGHYPTPEELAHARQTVGWQKVKMNAADHSVRFTTPGVEIDLGAIGKGYTVDRVVDVIREAGITAALVDAGSSTLYALGAPPGKNGWLVQVPRPGDREHTVSTVVLRDQSLSTSGSYEKFFQLNGRRYCHIMDPRTGKPVENVLQTTVIAPDGTTTDALSTSMFVMGPSAGKELLESVPHASGLWMMGEQASPRMVAWNWGGCKSGFDQDCAMNKMAQHNQIPVENAGINQGKVLHKR